MVSCRFDQRLPQPRDTVFEWHARPGAVTRLAPPFLAAVVREPLNGIREGARAELRLRGLPAPVNRWVAEYQDFQRPESFTDVALRSPFHSWEHRSRFEDLTTGTHLLDEVDFELPKVLSGPVGPLSLPAAMSAVRRTFSYRQRQLLDELSFAAAHPSPPLTVAISGASGLIGTQLRALLGTLGHNVVPLVRSGTPREGAIAWDPGAEWVDAEALRRADAVIHLAGEPIGKRFTSAHKAAIRDSRIGPTRFLARTLAGLADGPQTLVTASGIGYYGAQRPGLLEESAPAGDDFLALTCVDWEAATAPAAAAGLRVVQVRTGIVLTPAGGSLSTQLPLFRAGLGGPLGNPDAWLSWISIDDIVAMYAHALLTPSVSGPVNAVAPHPVQAGEFAHELGRTLHRPAKIPVPGFGPELLLGRQGARLLALASQRVSARRIESLGYEFRHPLLGDALRHVLGAAD